MEWGPEINHGGKRLPGLEDYCPVDAIASGIWRHTERGYRADCLTWDAYDAVRLRADHPYYKTPRTMTETDAKNMWRRVYFDSDLDSHAAFAECLRELGLIREETALDRYFAANPMTVSERDAVTAYAAWAEENA